MCTEPLFSIKNSTTDFNFYFSKAPSLSPSLSLSPTLSPAPSTGPVEGFTYIGDGICVDSQNTMYSGFITDINDANNNDCMKWCSQVQHPDFACVGVYDYGNGKRECFCGFSGGLPEDVDATSYSPVAEGFPGSGVGPVQVVDVTPGVSCYRYDVSFLFGCMSTSFITCCISLTVASFVYMKLELHPFSHWLPPSYKESQGAVIDGGSNPNV
jgi:hypothetical protein